MASLYFRVLCAFIVIHCIKLCVFFIQLPELRKLPPRKNFKRFSFQLFFCHQTHESLIRADATLLHLRRSFRFVFSRQVIDKILISVDWQLEIRTRANRMSDKMLDRNNNKSSLANKNVRYEVDVEYALQINRWLFKPLGVWPLSHQAGGVERNFARLLLVVCSFLLGFILVPGSLYTFVKEKNTGVRVKLVGALSFCVMAILKYGSLIGSRRDIGKCIEHLVDDWRRVRTSGDRDIMLAHALFGRYGSVICAIFMYGGGLFYAGIMPLLRGSVVVAELNMTIRPLAYPSYYVIFDPQINPAYRIVLSTHWCCAFVMHSIATAGCSMAVVFVMHACGQLEILVSWLNSLVDGNENQLESLDSRIACVIDHHVRVLRFVACVENILRTICLVEMAGCTLNLCLLGHYFLLEWEQSDAVAIMTYTILLMSFTFNIFLFCYIGELLTEECRKVGETTYMIDWYRLPAKKALGLVLTIATADRPATITAGRLVELSLTTFCTVVRTSVTYLNLLRTVVI